MTKSVNAFQNFVDPFDPSIDKDNLYNISSGAAVPFEIERDLFNAEKHRAIARFIFIEEWLEKGESFFEPIKRLNLKIMASIKKKVKLTSSQNKVVEYKHHNNIITSPKSEDGRIEMAELMKFCLMHLPYYIGTADGYLAKQQPFHP